MLPTASWLRVQPMPALPPAILHPRPAIEVAPPLLEQSRVPPRDPKRTLIIAVSESCNQEGDALRVFDQSMTPL